MQVESHIERNMTREYSIFSFKNKLVLKVKAILDLKKGFYDSVTFSKLSYHVLLYSGLIVRRTTWLIAQYGIG